MSTNTSEFWRFRLISIKHVYIIALKSYNFGGFGILLMSDVLLISGKTLPVDLETARGWIKS
jgi:Zn-dependent membrane protease YugP